MGPEYDFEDEANLRTNKGVEIRGGDRPEDYVPLFITPAMHTSRFPEYDDDLEDE